MLSPSYFTFSFFLINFNNCYICAKSYIIINYKNKYKFILRKEKIFVIKNKLPKI